MASTREVNEAVIRRLTSGNDRLVKEAQDTIDEYVRMRVREDGFLRRILPPVTVTAEDLTPQVDTDNPTIVIELEPDNPGAQMVPFATLPANRYIKGRRARLMLGRIWTPRFTADISKLMTYRMDIRQVLSDNAIKDLLAEEDGKFIQTVNSIVGTADSIVPYTGVAQHVNIEGGLTRDTLVEAMRIIPSTFANLKTATVLVNHYTIWEIVKWQREPVGGDLAQEMLINGFQEQVFMNARWIVSIRRGDADNLIPDNTLYLFAEPKYLGKFAILDDATMVIDRYGPMIEFSSYETVGAIVANIAAVGRANFVEASATPTPTATATT